jgi:hypothetical protein
VKVALLISKFEELMPVSFLRILDTIHIKHHFIPEEKSNDFTASEDGGQK